ncbi:MAG: NADH-quinone oxidoreductase subunit M [Chloroflexi bacterium]|nr:NADH-quinone oxidoreductase subunit M [Chloroflexota bacterium]
MLTLIWLLPMIAAVVLMLMPKEQLRLIKGISIGTAFITLVISIIAYFKYDVVQGGFQFVETFSWIPALGISYKLGADGITVPMLLLTGLIIFAGTLMSSTLEDFREKEFFVLLLVLVAGVYGVFVALDLFLLLVFYELAVLPMYILIAVWGSTRKEYSAMKLTLYLLGGSAFSLVGIIAMYWAGGKHTFDMVQLATANFSREFQVFFFLPIFVGFSVLAGLWPFHTWSPDGHVAAPTAVSMLHAGVLMKLGAYAALRVGVFLLPQGAQVWLPWIVLLTVVNVVYGAFVAMSQRDMKYMVGFSSVSHMGLVTMGIATMNSIGMSGAVYQMFSHGVMTGLMFAVVGQIYKRAHTRDMPSLGGLLQKTPWMGIAFIICALTSMGLPGFSGFIAEFQIFVGTWSAYPILAAIAALGIIITAAYLLRVVYQVFFGSLKVEFEHLTDSKPIERLAMGLLVAALIIFGLLPTTMVNMINSGVAPVIARLTTGS